MMMNSGTVVEDWWSAAESEHYAIVTKASWRVGKAIVVVGSGTEGRDQKVDRLQHSQRNGVGKGWRKQGTSS